MAGGAILGRRFIEQDGLGGNHPGQLVTLRAAHILVSSTQGEGRPFVVIEQGRLPLCGAVTIRTSRNIRYGELLSVNVLMAVFALSRCGLEINVRYLHLEVGRLVTVDAGRGAVGPKQSELRLGMIKPGEFLP